MELKQRASVAHADHSRSPRSGTEQAVKPCFPRLVQARARQNHRQWKDDGDLGIALREPIEADLPPHNHPVVRKDISESLLENAELDWLATVGRHTLGIFAQLGQAEPEIASFGLLLADHEKNCAIVGGWSLL